jgi:hypothetical protein
MLLVGDSLTFADIAVGEFMKGFYILNEYFHNVNVQLHIINILNLIDAKGNNIIN